MALTAPAYAHVARLQHARENTIEVTGEEMADHKVTVEKLPNGKWACFLHLQGHDGPINLGKEFKSDEQAETWLDVSESVTAIEMMIRKYKK